MLSNRYILYQWEHSYVDRYTNPRVRVPFRRWKCRTCSVSGTGRCTKTLGNGAGPELEAPGRRRAAAGAWSTSWRWPGAGARRPQAVRNRRSPGPAGQRTREDGTRPVGRRHSVPCRRCTCTRWPVRSPATVPTTVLRPSATRKRPLRGNSTRRSPGTRTARTSDATASAWTRPPPRCRFRGRFPATSSAAGTGTAVATVAAVPSRPSARPVRSDTVGRPRSPRHGFRGRQQRALAVCLRTAIVTSFR